MTTAAPTVSDDCRAQLAGIGAQWRAALEPVAAELKRQGDIVREWAAAVSKSREYRYHRAVADCEQRREYQQQGLEQIADRSQLELLQGDDESAQLAQTDERHRHRHRRRAPEPSVIRQLATVRTPNAPSHALVTRQQGAP